MLGRIPKMQRSASDVYRAMYHNPPSDWKRPPNRSRQILL